MNAHCNGTSSDWTFCKALKNQVKRKPFEFITLVTAILGVAFAIISIRDVEKQLKTVTDALESQAYSYIDTNQHELDKIMIENAKFRSYFEAKKLPEDLSSDDRIKLKALVDLKLDIIDSFYSQSAHINWKNYTLSSWENYYENSFARSPAMCEQICKDWEEYGNHIRQVAVKDHACGKSIKAMLDEKEINKARQQDQESCKYEPMPKQESVK